MKLGIRTDGPMAEFVLYGHDDNVVNKATWNAERELAHQLLQRIEDFLADSAVNLDDVTGLFVFRGPGSYTGLRIGLTVMNTIAYAKSIPIVGVEGEGWRADAVERLRSGDDDRAVLPNYGGDARITKARK